MKKIAIYVDDELFTCLRRFVAEAEIGRVTIELLSERVAQFGRDELTAQMREGYIATRGDRDELNADWDALDGEGWPSCTS